MSYNYIASAQPATAVRAALVCNFTSSSAQNLVIAKSNRIKVHALCEGDGGPEGLASVIEEPLNGRIAALSVYRPPNEDRDLIFVLVERHLFCVLGYNPETKELVTRLSGDVKDKVGRPLEDGPQMLVDPNDRMMGMRLYEGFLKILPLDRGLQSIQAFNIRLPELKVLDVQFLHECLKPTVCVLYNDMDQVAKRHVKTYAVEVRDKELAQGPWEKRFLDETTSRVIAVPRVGGVLLVASSSITYVGPDGGGVQGIMMNDTIITSHCVMDETEDSSASSSTSDFQRFLLGDMRGAMSILILQISDGQVCGISVDVLGITSIPRALCYLGTGTVFVGSTYGDAQLIRLSEEPDDEGCCVQVLEEYVNIGPVTDMCVVESGTQGQSQLVLCSGAFKDGSLRVVRAGIGINEQASIEAPGIKGLWRLAAGSPHDKFLVQSFIGETRVLMFEGEELGEAEIAGFATEQSLFCSDVAGACLLQVTRSAARLVCATSLELLDSYQPDSTITVATAQGAHVVLASSGGKVTLLEVDPVARKLRVAAVAEMGSDVACLALGSVGGDGDDNDRTSGDVCGIPALPSPTMLAVGTWSDAAIRMLALPTLVEATRTDLGVDVQARDVLIVRMGCVDYLLVGLGDGTLLSYELNDLSFSGSGSGSSGSGSGHDDGLFGCARRVMLGTRPIRLSVFHTDDGRNTRVFVSCDRPTVVYSRNGKLHFSVVNIPEVGCMVPLSSEVFPDCLAMATETDLMIGTVDSIQEVHIKKQHFGYDLRRIAHHPQAGFYVVLAERVESTGQGEVVKRFVLFLDDCSFEEVHCHRLEPQETGLSICVAPLKVFNSDGEAEKPNSPPGHGAGAGAGSDDESGGQMDYVAVGTATVVEGEWEPRQGAVQLFRVSVTDGVKRIVAFPAKLMVNCAVFSIAAVEGRLVAAIGSTVHMLHLDSSNTGHTSEPTLRSECHMDGHINALYIKARGDLILMGDMMRSMTLLKYVPRVAAVAGAEGTGTRAKLEMVSRDYNAHNMRAVGFVDEEFFLGAEDYGNIIVMRRAVDSTTDDAQLKDVAEFHLGDYPNVFVTGSLNSQPAEQGDAGGAPDGLNFGTGSTTGTTSLGVSMALGADSSGAGSRKFTSTLFGTVSGAIGVIMHIDKDSFRFYNALETCIKQALPPIGGLPHKFWRNFQNERRIGQQRNCVDGDLVEAFLELEGPDKDTIVQNLNDHLGLTAQTLPKGVVPVSSGAAALGADAPVRAPFSLSEVEAKVESMIYLH